MEVGLYYNNTRVPVPAQQFTLKRKSPVWSDKVFPTEYTFPFKLNLSDEVKQLFGFPGDINALNGVPEKLDVVYVDLAGTPFPALLYFKEASGDTAECYVIINKSTDIESVTDTSLQEQDFGRIELSELGQDVLLQLVGVSDIVGSEVVTVTLTLSGEEYQAEANVATVGHFWFLEELARQINNDPDNDKWVAEAVAPQHIRLTNTTNDQRNWFTIENLDTQYTEFDSGNTPWYWWEEGTAGVHHDQWLEDLAAEVEAAIDNYIDDPDADVFFPMWRNIGLYDDVNRDNESTSASTGPLLYHNYYKTFSVGGDGEILPVSVQSVASNDILSSQNYLTPMFRLLYIIKKIYAKIGYSVQAPFFQDPELYDIGVYSNKPLGFLYNIYRFGWDPGEIMRHNRYVPGNVLHIADFFPDMTAKDFLVAIKKQFDLLFHFDTVHKVVTIDSFRNYYLKGQWIDQPLRRAFKRLPFLDTIKSIAFAGNSDDALQENLKVHQQPVLVDDTANVDVEIEAAIPRDENIEFSSYRTPLVQITPASSSALTLFFYKGIREAIPDPNPGDPTKIYPMASILNVDANGNTIGNYTLSLQGTNGLYEIWLKYRVLALARAMVIKMTDIISIHDMYQLENGAKSLIHGQFFSWSEITYKPINDTDIQAESELIRL